MIELLILYSLYIREATMYSIQKCIKENFSPYSSPSFGALNPALKRLENNDYIKCRQVMSEGGKLSCYYENTSKGNQYMKKLILEPLSDNPQQFFSKAGIKISMADVLNFEEKNELFIMLKSYALKFKNSAENIFENEYNKINFYQKLAIDNTICEYKNFINMVEGLEKDNARNS